MRDLVVISIVLGSIPLIIFRPYIGVLVFCWLGFMNPHRLAWGLAASMPLSQAVAVATLIGWFISQRGDRRLPLTSESVVLFLFGIWATVTTFFALVPEDAWTEWDRFWKIQLVVFLTITLMVERKRLDALIWVIALSIGFYGVRGGLFTLLTGGNYLVFGPADSFIGGNNEIALALIVTLPLVRYLERVTTRAWVRQGLRVSMLLFAFAIFGTHSRGALVGFAVTAVFFVWKSRHRIVLGLSVICAATLLLSFMPEHWTERMGTIETYQEDSSAMGRINAWWFAFNVAKDRPITGGGFNTFSPDLFRRYAPDPEDFHDAHSIYFEVLGEHGFVGLFLFLLLGVSAWRSCSWIVVQASHNPDIAWLSELARMLQVSLVGYAATGAFLGLAYFDLYYNLLAIIVIAKLLTRDHLLQLRELESEDHFVVEARGQPSLAERNVGGPAV